jgi:hypothetical protein
VAPGRGQTCDTSVLAHDEVISPGILTRIVKIHARFRFWIYASDIGSLVKIALCAGPRKIVCIVGATVNAGDNMIDMKWQGIEFF